MKYSLFALAAITATASAFAPLNNGASSRVKSAVKSSIGADNERPIRDPFGLYPSNSPERMEGRIEPLEQLPSANKPVTDPLNLYDDKSAVSVSPDMSMSLPFLERPAMLDGTVAGDRGFDPFNFSNNEQSLQWYRNAEIKHARLAMLAAVGWPLAELFNKSIDRAPSVLNGGLGKVTPVFWAGLLTILSAVELLGIFNDNREGSDYMPGNYGFNPLRLLSQNDDQRKFSMEAELFNGRLAMLAIFGFAMQEFVTKVPVIEQTPFFFKPFF